MSKYTDTNKSNFLEPQVNQYGRNMVMTNVIDRETKRKYVNLDTKFRDDYTYNSNATCNITLPDRLTNVKSIMVCNVEIPLTFYNISENLGNNCFSVTNTNTNVTTLIIVPDGNYNISQLTTFINRRTTLINSLFSFQQSSNGFFSKFVNTSSETFIVNFDVNFDVNKIGTPDTIGSFDKYNFKSKLGWILGYRLREYTFGIVDDASTSPQSECFINVNGPKYLYLVIDEFSQKNPNSFISPQSGFSMSKNILARISINSASFPFGSILPANNFNGLLLTDKRNYGGAIDIKKMNVQLVNESGIPMNLNGLDFSFCLEVEHE